MAAGAWIVLSRWQGHIAGPGYKTEQQCEDFDRDFATRKKVQDTMQSLLYYVRASDADFNKLFVHACWRDIVDAIVSAKVLGPSSDAT